MKWVLCLLRGGHTPMRTSISVTRIFCRRCGRELQYVAPSRHHRRTRSQPPSRRGGIRRCAPSVGSLRQAPVRSLSSRPRRSDRRRSRPAREASWSPAAVRTIGRYRAGCWRPTMRSLVGLPGPLRGG